jgi:hypothetical protein
MRQVDTARKRLADRGAWFRVGLTSATIAAPLISRWNDLRAGERAREYAEEAEARLHDIGARVPWSRGNRLQREAVEMVREVSERATGQRQRASSIIWLAGVGVGLVAAGAGAYVLVRRRLDAELDEPLIAVMSSGPNSNGHGRANGASNGSGAPAAATSATTNAPSASAAPSTPTSSETATSAPSVSNADEGASNQADEAPINSENVERARYIGNIRTMVFHEANADGLPAEENRIYFPSEADALEAGYHRDRDEVSPPTESGSPTGNLGAG